MLRIIVFVVIAFFYSVPACAGDKPLRIAVFEADITPPIGTPLCDGLVAPAKAIVDRLTARAIVILTEDRPIVLCALDWVAIGTSAYHPLREPLPTSPRTPPHTTP